MPDSIVTPVNASHAIKEVVFVLQFGTQFDEARLLPLKDLHEKVKSELPRLEEIGAVGFQIKDNRIVQPQERVQQLAGLRFSHFTADGHADWMVRIERDFITVNCLAYDRWKTIYPRAAQYLRLFGRDVVGPAMPIKNIALQYIDRFLYHGEHDQYDCSEVFDSSSRYLPPNVTDVGPFWHVHQGWFSTYNTSERILNRLNIDVAEAEGEHQTTIDHQGQWQFREGITGARALLGSEDADSGRLDEIMDHLHDLNKDVLRSVLNQEMRDWIGLDQE